MWKAQSSEGTTQGRVSGCGLSGQQWMYDWAVGSRDIESVNNFFTKKFGRGKEGQREMWVK